MGRYKLGRLPATRPGALDDLLAYTTGKLPAPPAGIPVPATPYPIDGNDQYGDCTIAGCDHLARAWDAETGEHDHLPTEEQIVDEYFKLTGGEDTGLNEAEVLKTWHGEGLHLFGGQIAGYAPVPPTKLLQIHQAVAFYGGCYLGIECPESAQTQFANGEPWTYTGSEVEGGHCIVAVGYTPTSLLCATWGGIAEVTAGFMAHYLDEAWVVLSHQMVEAKGDRLGLDLAALQADLARV